MVDIDEIYKRWVARADAELQDELSRMESAEGEREDAFFQDLAFGTGGLRGLIGAGPNRMNVHTVGRATQGLADYLNARFENPSVAIARDSRHMGDEFVCVVAGVLAANGVRSFAYPRVEPTPALSWAVRYLGCSAGICITASHNPAAYNGYKVYGPDGCQITTQAARDIQERIAETDTFDGVRAVGFDEALASGMFSWIGDEVLDNYISAVAALSPAMAASGMGGESALSDLSVTYTPLNGTGLECVERILQLTGVGKVDVVEEQAAPDGDFPTCPYPNPEVPEALELGLRNCRDNCTDLLLASDPDADRMGVAVVRDGQPVILTGNEVGILLLDYLCNMLEAHGERIGEKVVATTIVSTPMADALARSWGFELRRTLTGFKFIGEQIGLLERAGQVDRFMFGFEESCGYLSGTHVRDKDAVNAAMLVCEAAGWHRAEGRDLTQAMRQLYEHYGFFEEGLVSVGYPGANGAQAMADIMRNLRENPPRSIAGLAVDASTDYAGGAPMPIVNPHSGESQQLPPANVLEFALEGGSKLIVRPSGTEPKVKAYVMVREETDDAAEGLLKALKSAVTETLLI